MKVRYEKGSENWQMFVDYYEFIQDFGEPEESDKWWQKLIEKSDELCSKYGKRQYIRDLVMAHINELERKASKAK